MAEGDNSTNAIEQRSGGCRLRLLVAPRAGKSRIVGIHDHRIKIRVAAAPVDNAANDALVRLLASKLGVRKSDVRMISGHSSRRKTVHVSGITVEAVTRALSL